MASRLVWRVLRRHFGAFTTGRASASMNHLNTAVWGVPMKLRWMVSFLFLALSCCVSASLVLAGNPDGITGGNADSTGPVISADGQYVVFVSAATNLVPNDTNNQMDVFLWEGNTRQITRISVASDGTQADGMSGDPSISADGRFITFVSPSTNLIPGASSGQWNTYLYDRETKELSLAIVGSDGAPLDGANDGAITADGRYVYFASTAASLGASVADPGIFARDLWTGHTTRIDTTIDGLPPNGPIWGWRSISPDGRYIAFDSEASSFVPGDTNGIDDAFVHDLLTGQTERVSVANDGSQAMGPDDQGNAVINADGRFVAFVSSGALVPGLTYVGNMFVRDRQASTTELISYDPSGNPYGVWTGPMAISADGRLVAFSEEVPSPYLPNYLAGVRDRQAQKTVELQGYPLFGGGQMSANGRYVAVSASSAGSDYREHFHLGARLLNFGVIAGTVTDAGTGSPVPHAGIWIGGSLYTAADKDGNYSIEVAETTNTSVEVTASMYADLVQPNLAVTAGVTTTVNVALQPEFTDLPTTNWAAQSVGACVDAGIVNGYSDGTYKPTDPVTRDQMAVYISRALAGGDAQVPSGPATATFSDVPTDYWAFKYVEYAVSKAVVKGYSDGTYKPADQVTRDQMAVFIARAIATPTDGADLVNYTPPATPTFPDVATTFWAYKYVEYIAQPTIGVTQGYPDGDYHPEYICTRDQMAVYVARAFKLAG